jgi:exodeoxyribonuclease VII small subunit
MAKSSAPPASFEAALAELEEIVATMEGGQVPLKESLAAYKRGTELLQYCQSALKDAEQQVRVFEKGLLKAFEAPDVDEGGNDES